MMDPSPEDSPTGLYGARPADILHGRFRRGNSESVRQLSLRVRLAEERANKFRNEKEELRFENEKLSRELDESRNTLISTRKELQTRIEELEKQLRDCKSQGSKTRVQELISLFGVSVESKSCEPPYLVPEKICFDVSVGTDPEASCSEEGISEKASQDHSVPTDFGDHYSLKSHFEERTNLEADKFFLETQLKLARSKIDRFGLQEIQMKNLEKRNVALSEMVDRLIVENEKLKDVATTKVDDGSEGKAASRRLIDVTLEYQTKLDGKVAELELKAKQLEELTRVHNSALTSLETLKDKYNLLEEKLSEVQSTWTEEQTGEDVKTKLQKYVAENAKLKERLSKYEKESDSDGTMILHYRMNPLDMANQEYREFETNRKRKAEVSILYDPNELDSTVRKKQHEELVKQVSDLQFQLHKSEKEKERALKIQSDLVKQYRAIVIALSGWQIKMKDDGFAEIESVFSPGNFFVFKVENFGKSVSLLETDYAKKWSNQIEEYLEGRDSVPAFLAAVTLILDERSHSTQCTLTFNSSD